MSIFSDGRKKVRVPFHGGNAGSRKGRKEDAKIRKGNHASLKTLFSLENDTCKLRKSREVEQHIRENFESVARPLMSRRQKDTICGN